MAGRKPTNAEVQERIEFVRELITRRCLTGVIKSAYRKRFPMDGADHATILRYMARAREQILADVQRGRAALRAESQTFYESIIADPGTEAKDRIKAQERIDKLLGLEDRTEPDGLEEFLDRLPPELSGPIREALRK